MKRSYMFISPIALVLLLVANCKSSSTAELDYLHAEPERVALVQKLRLLDLRLSQAGPSLESLDELHQRYDDADKLRRELREAKLTLVSAIHQAEEGLADHKKRVIAMKRAAACGKKLAKFTTNSQIYQDVIIKMVTDAGLQLSHATGSARVTPMQLSIAQREEFGLSVEQALGVLAKEAVQQQEYIESSDRAIAAQNAKESAQLAEQKAKVEEARKTSSLLASYRSKVEGSALSTTPQTKVYRVRSRPTTSYFYNYNYGRTYRPYAELPLTRGASVNPPCPVIPYSN